MTLGLGRWRGERQTSTGVGHVYIPSLPFHVDSNKGLSLPPLLQRPTPVPTSRYFSVTYQSEHNQKPLTGPLANTRHPKATPHWDACSLNELAQRCVSVIFMLAIYLLSLSSSLLKLRNCEPVRLISRPVSEMQDRYRGQTAPQSPLLDHYCPLLARYGQLDPGQALTVTVDPCVSTTHVDYRRYSRSETAPLTGQADTSYLSLTKSSAHSRLPAHKTPPTVSCHPRLPRPSVPLPYTGKHSLYGESFQVPVPHPAPSESLPGPAWTGSGDAAKRGLFRNILEVPKMYLTENQAYGGNQTVLV
ncbi:hypothetical protein DPEC_G00309420 [Dallia pectoralis]|uniref:Uncharacterized protein n=1 Tax=Dallia pectoralis TaxID=75939 RepID=A0ACC2FF41_DALPE|nr:hypothetical protein DPEC_G00309420 [Dallia pectoralis]